MPPILVSGLINIETTLKVEGFPIPYFPVCYPFFGVQSRVSGVGYNVTRALHTLGDEVRFLSLVGGDSAGELVRSTLRGDGLPGERVLPLLDETAQSVILYDGDGRRQIHTDLKDVQERVYPFELFEEALDGCGLAALCNINFSRPFLQAARARGVPVATDLHALGDLDDAYNRDFMAAAEILFLSHEHLPCAPEEFAGRLLGRYGMRLVVIGLGGAGALLAERGAGMQRVAAVVPRPIVNTIGAGDALFSAFLHGTAGGLPPYEALRRAVVFASWKIGVRSAAEGFLGAQELDQLVRQVYSS